MTTLTNTTKNLSTEMLIEMFRELESNDSKGSDMVNDAVMNELELRLSEEAFCELLDEVYAD